MTKQKQDYIRSVISVLPGANTTVVIPLAAGSIITCVQLSLACVNAAAAGDGLLTLSCKMGPFGSSADTSEVLAIINVASSTIGGANSNSVAVQTARFINQGETMILACAGAAPTSMTGYACIHFIPPR